MNRVQERGFALVTAIMLLAALAAMLGAHFLLTRVDLSVTKTTMDRTKGFYAAEAGLNVRAQQLREEFEGYNRPAGTTPVDPPGELPCQGDVGAGDFGCQTFTFQLRDVLTYVEEDAGNPVAILIPPGEPYQNLNAQEYRYTVSSLAVNSAERPEAVLGMRFKSRLVPLFQFAAFYDKDFEAYPGPAMTLDGPVHANGDLYLGADTSLTLNGQLTASHDGNGLGGRVFNGRKYDDCCSTDKVRVYDGAAAVSLPFGPNRYEVTPPEQVPWNGWIQSGLDPVTVPPPEALDAAPGQLYWDKADVRIMLNLEDGGAIEVRNANGTKNDALSDDLNITCAGVAQYLSAAGGTVKNWRENTFIEMLDVDVRGLLDCIDDNHGLMGGKDLDDSTEGGLVFYLGVDGPIPQGTVNNYGVRVHNGAELAATDGDPQIQGLTVVTDQAVYIRGDYNSDADNWKPAAFLADSLNVLSNAWSDANSNSGIGSRVASDTAVYAGFLAGTDSTGGVELTPLDGFTIGDAYNGGLENYPRFHENWNNKWLTYRGSFVSLDTPRHVDGSWGVQSYSPPKRNWGFETRFRDAANLPPLSPRFVYLSQELFVREFEY